MNALIIAGSLLGICVSGCICGLLISATVNLSGVIADKLRKKFMGY